MSTFAPAAPLMDMPFLFRDVRERLDRLAADGLIELLPFEDRDELLARTSPVREAYAQEVGATDVYTRIAAAGGAAP